MAMYKKLGLSSEEVAELGKWKDIKTFSEYYLRLHACQRASDQLSIFVHNVSPLECAEPDMSHSHPKPFEGGRSDMEGEAQNKGEPTQPTQLKRKFSSSSAFRPPPPQPLMSGHDVASSSNGSGATPLDKNPSSPPLFAFAVSSASSFLKKKSAEGGGQLIPDIVRGGHMRSRGGRNPAASTKSSKDRPRRPNTH